MPFYITAWLASFFYGLIGITGKLTSKYSIPNLWLFNFLYVLFTFLILLPIALPYQHGLPVRWEFIIAAGITSALFSLLYITSLYVLDLSTFIPLFNIRTVVGLAIGAVFLGETLSTGQYLLSALIIFAGVFVTLDERWKLSSFLSPSVLIGILCAISLGVTGAFIKLAIQQTSYWQTTLWLTFVASLVTLLTIPKFMGDIRKIKLTQIGAVFLMAVFQAIADMFANKSFEKNLGLSSVIISLPLSMVMAVLLSRLIPSLLEKHTLKVYIVRFAAAAVMIASALKITQ